MSKKFEVIQRAVFFSQQKPELLANYLVDLIPDVATKAEVTGDSAITVSSTDVTKTYDVKLYSQFGDLMTGSKTFSLETPKTGVAINSSTGVLTVTASTVTSGSVVVVGVIGGVTGKKTVSITKQ